MRGALPLAIGFALAVLLQLVIGPFAGPFAVKLLMDIGINIILAVSLNLVSHCDRTAAHTRPTARGCARPRDSRLAPLRTVERAPTSP